MAAVRAASRQVGMDGFGDRLRARARELGFSDAEVARRAGLGQTRYAGYVTDRHEPDFATLRRICAVLGISASDLLDTPAPATIGARALRARISSAVEALDERSLEIAAVVVDGLVARLGYAHAKVGGAEEPEET